MKHTAGPWVYTKGMKCERITSPNIGYKYANGEIPKIANVNRHLSAKGLKHYEVDEEAEANARLISCAPEMLKVLITIAKEFKGHNMYDYLTPTIEKATGMTIDEVIK